MMTKLQKPPSPALVAAIAEAIDDYHKVHPGLMVSEVMAACDLISNLVTEGLLKLDDGKRTLSK